MSIAKIVDPPMVPTDLASELGPQGVREILEVLWLSYHDMVLQKHAFDLTSREDNITEIWAVYVQRRWYKENRALEMNVVLDPVMQHLDDTKAKAIGQSPRIDYCFRALDPDKRYFGIECKNLAVKKNKLYDRYVETGIGNYSSGRYGSTSTENALIGYVLQGDIYEVVEKLNKKVEKDISTLDVLNRDFSFLDSHYHSRHTRVLDGKAILLDHLFFDLTPPPSTT